MSIRKRKTKKSRPLASTLLEIIEALIREKGGVADLKTIYQGVEAIRPETSKATIRAIIRDACVGSLRIHTNTPRFVKISQGTYGLHASSKRIYKQKSIITHE